jgi:FkbM family methyltransferase
VKKTLGAFLLAFKSYVAKKIRQHPSYFDTAKRISRIFGDTNPMYEFLREFASQFPNCKFIQVGSNDGLSNDPLREFILSQNWSGILVEPTPSLFRQLQLNYYGRPGLYFENVAISNCSDRLNFYMIKEDELSSFPEYARQINSLDKTHILTHFRDVPNMEEKIDVYPVECMTLTQLLTKHDFASIDLLLIDAEGHEHSILTSIEFSIIKPKGIIFEGVHLKSEDRASLFRDLKNEGYVLFDCTGRDVVAVVESLPMIWHGKRLL